MAYASLLRPQQRNSHTPKLICGFNSKDVVLREKKTKNSVTDAVEGQKHPSRPA